MKNNQQPYDLDNFWEKTNDGLDFFLDEFSSEIAKNNGKVKGFRVRTDDKTGSCHLSRSKKTGKWLFTDFGVEPKGVNAIDYVMKRDNCDFLNACKVLFTQYSIEVGEYQKNEPKTEFSANVTEEKGFFEVDFHKQIKSEKALKKIFPFYNDWILSEYDFKEISSYTSVGTNKDNHKYKRTITATDTYPIFGYDKSEFVKLYAPMAPKGDKFLLKHSFVGQKPHRFIYGWDRLFSSVDYDQIKRLYIKLELANDYDKSSLLEELNELKLDKVIIATGGSDGINIASLGYDVIWFNSESETINKEEFAELSKIAKNIYYIPDNDKTGIKQGKNLGFLHLELKILWLPETIQLGFYEKKVKDFRDWITIHKAEPYSKIQFLFERMLKNALNFRFWDYSDKGAVQINEKKLLLFLKHKDFRRYIQPYRTSDTGKEEEGYFVKVEKSKITQVYPTDIRAVVLDWLDKGFHPTKVYNKVLRSPFFNQTQLKALPYFTYEKNHTGKDFQYFFFENIAVKISKNAIEPLKYEYGLDVNYWGDKAINHHFTVENAHFETYNDQQGRLRIKTLKKDSNYFKVLINTSRIHWMKDADPKGKDTNIFNINSVNLTDEENALQELHLLNKIYCVGYLLHQYKVKSKAKLVLGVDHVGGESVRGSYGGTGKSFLQESLNSLLKLKSISGQTLKNDSFPFDGVTPKTEMVLLDDLAPYQNYRDFFVMVTSNFTANQKGGVKYDIPFEDSAKVGGTTNFAPDLNDGSTKRRLLIYQNSDYYHASTDENDYTFSRKISDDFNNQDILSRESSTEEWNADYNFMLQCLQFYLSQTEEIEAPLGNVMVKGYLMQIGDNYVRFFKSFFDSSNPVGKWIDRKSVVEEAKNELGNKFQSTQRFNFNLKLYCKSLGLEIEEKKRRNDSGSSVIHFLITKKNTEKQSTIDFDQEEHGTDMLPI